MSTEDVNGVSDVGEDPEYAPKVVDGEVNTPVDNGVDRSVDTSADPAFDQSNTHRSGEGEQVGIDYIQGQFDDQASNEPAEEPQTSEYITLPTSVEAHKAVTGVRTDKGVSFGIAVSLGTVISAMSMRYRSIAPEMKGLHIYKRVLSGLHFTKIFLFSALVAGIVSELFTGALKSGFAITSYALILVLVLGAIYTILQSHLATAKFREALTGDAPRNRIFISLSSFFVGGAALYFLIESTVHIAKSGAVVLGNFGSASNPDGILNDHTLLSSSPSGALIQSLPIAFLGIAGVFGLFTGLYYLVRKEAIRKEIGKLTDFKVLYQNGSAVISE